MSSCDLEYFYVVKDQPEDNILYFWPGDTKNDAKLNTVGLMIGLLNFFQRTFGHRTKSVRSDKYDDYSVRVGNVFVCCRLQKRTSADNRRPSESFDPTHDLRSSMTRLGKRQSMSLRRAKAVAAAQESFVSFEGDRFLPHTEYMIRQIRLSVCLFRLFYGGNFLDPKALARFYDCFIYRFLLRGKQQSDFRTGLFIAAPKPPKKKKRREGQGDAAPPASSGSADGVSETPETKVSGASSQREGFESLTAVTPGKDPKDAASKSEVTPTSSPSSETSSPDTGTPDSIPMNLGMSSSHPPQLLVEFLSSVRRIRFRSPRAFMRVFRFIEHLAHDIRDPTGVNAIGCALFQNGQYLHGCGVPPEFLCPLVLYDRFFWARKGDGAQEDLFARMYFYDPKKIRPRDDPPVVLEPEVEREAEGEGEVEVEEKAPPKPEDRPVGTEVLKEKEYEECYLHVMEIDARLRLCLFFILREPSLRSVRVRHRLLSSIVIKDRSFVPMAVSEDPPEKDRPSPPRESSFLGFSPNTSSAKELFAAAKGAGGGASMSMSMPRPVPIPVVMPEPTQVSASSPLRVDYNKSLMTLSRNFNSFFLLYILSDFLDQRRKQRQVIYKLTRSMWIVCLKKSVDAEYCFVVLNEKNLTLGAVQQRVWNALRMKE